MSRTLAAALTAGALLWCALLIAAPFAVARGGGAFATPIALLYQASSRICHQRPERSFHIAGVQQPVCARCFGLYGSGAAGALLGWTAIRRRRDSFNRGLLLACAVPTALTFGLEAANLAHPSSALRAWAALPLGLAAGWMFIGGLRE